MESDRMVKGMVFMSFEERLAEARLIYMEAINTAVNEAVEQFILPSDKLTLCDDAAMFMIFTLVIKRAEISGDTIQLKSLMPHLRRIVKLLENDLPPMLHAFAAAAAEENKPAQGEVN